MLHGRGPGPRFAGQARSHRISAGLQACVVPVGAGLSGEWAAAPLQPLQEQHCWSRPCPNCVNNACGNTSANRPSPPRPWPVSTRPMSV
ncbi:hypothetical protein E8E68_06400 [Pseudomonas sp. BN607]|nr:hypothetical protein [Pseudomonas sp. BN607]